MVSFYFNGPGVRKQLSHLDRSFFCFSDKHAMLSIFPDHLFGRSLLKPGGSIAACFELYFSALVFLKSSYPIPNYFSSGLQLRSQLKNKIVELVSRVGFCAITTRSEPGK